MSPSITRRFCRLLMLALFGAGRTGAAQLPADSLRLVDRIFAALDHTDTPGCIVGADRGGRPLLRRAYGMANLELGIALTPASVLETGSVAKQFTAAAVVHLALNGRLQLDAPLGRYLPELGPRGDSLTARMVLTHTAGVRDVWALMALAGVETGQVHLTMEQAWAMLARQRPGEFAPNARYAYSNGGYVLLAELVRRVSGRSLAEYSRDAVFEPLGLGNTQWRDDWNRVIPRRATAYRPAGDGRFRVDMPFSSVYGQGGLLTTVDDLLRWNGALDHGGAPWRALRDSLERRGRLTSGRALEYALGVRVFEYRGVREVSHIGNTASYWSYLGRLPSIGLSVAVLCNHGGADAPGLARQVIDLLMPVGIVPAPGATAPGTAPLDSAHLGRYADPRSADVIELAAHEGRMAQRLQGRTLPLRAAGVGRYEWDAAIYGEVSRPMAIILDPPVQRRSPGLLVTGPDGDSVRYERVGITPGASAAERAAYVGTYHSDELAADYVVAAEGDVITVRAVGIGGIPAAFGGPVVTLPRNARDLFGDPGLLTVRFTRREGRVTGFRLDLGPALAGIRFVRR